MLGAVLVGHPAELLKDSTVAFKNLTVDLAVLRSDLAVEVRVLYFNLHIVRYSKWGYLIWQISQ
jgi:hypothetical protein